VKEERIATVDTATAIAIQAIIKKISSKAIKSCLDKLSLNRNCKMKKNLMSILKVKKAIIINMEELFI
jgi:hypothetical protein